MGFILMQALTLACFGLVGANAGALAMEPVGHIAGTASALQGLITTTGGALIGLVIGQMFDGTTLPLVAGFAVCGGARADRRALGQSQGEGRARWKRTRPSSDPKWTKWTPEGGPKRA